MQAAVLQDILHGLLQCEDDGLLGDALDELAAHGVSSVETFEGADILTNDKGLVINVGGSEFQVTIVKSA